LFKVTSGVEQPLVNGAAVFPSVLPAQQQAE